MINQPDVVVVDQKQKRGVVIDMAITGDTNIGKKEHEKNEKAQTLKEQMRDLEGESQSRSSGEWLQQNLGTTPEVFV